MVLPNTGRSKSIPWTIHSDTTTNTTPTTYPSPSLSLQPKQTLGSSRPMFSTTVPSLSAPASPTQRIRKQHAPEIIHVPQRPSSMIATTSNEGLGDFLNSLSQLEGNVTGVSKQYTK
ncbi:hypothetical protein G6F56_009887 [Rhizopus delemar]|nr:hypothetical protein G6F56_009887 [Rhizopus delemar]